MNQYLDSTAKATEDNNLTYIRRDLIENYQDYFIRLGDFIENIDIGDYVPPGVYVNEENNELIYCVNIRKQNLHI